MAYYWQSKGRSFGWGFAISMFFTPAVAMLIGLILNPHRDNVEQLRLESGRFKACPQCAELVRQQAKICRFCNYKFGDPLYEELRERVEFADQIRAQFAHEYQDQLPNLDTLLTQEAYRILQLPEDFHTQAKYYSKRKLQQIFTAFPSQTAYRQALERALQDMLTLTECPFCQTLQPRDNIVCTTCYKDLKQLNPETGEIEPLR